MLPTTLKKLALNDPRKAQALGKELIDYVDSLKPSIVESMEEDAVKRIREKIAHLPFEMFCAAIYDSNKRFVHLWEGSKGGTDVCTLYLSPFLKEILNANGTSVYLAHNHPNGSEIPSRADINLTHIIQPTFNLMDIHIHHFLITAKSTIPF